MAPKRGEVKEPSSKITSRSADAKKPRLTLSELASYDDICTDALIDNVYFWSSIRKNRAKYSSSRGIRGDEITQILQRDVVCNTDVKSAETKLLDLRGFKSFLPKLQSPRELNDFKKHLRKYIDLWLPDSPFEVSTTNRYTITTQEAAVVARRNIKKGETIKYLCGTLVEMTPAEEKDLDLTRRDFSIVTSSRKKKSLLFLGPARFANHDCNANARLTNTASDGMSVVATRPITQNEEITVVYGEDYFGVGNCECLCGTCESNTRGGWTLSPGTPAKEQTPATASEEPNEPYSFRRKRKYDRVSSSPIASSAEDFVPATRRRSSGSDRSRPSSLTPPSGLKRKRKPRVPSALSRFSPEVNDESAVTDDDAIGSSMINVAATTAHPLIVRSESDLKDQIEASKVNESAFEESIEESEENGFSDAASFDPVPHTETNSEDLGNTAVKIEVAVTTNNNESSTKQRNSMEETPQSNSSTAQVDQESQGQIQENYGLQRPGSIKLRVEKRKFDEADEAGHSFSPSKKARTETAMDHLPKVTKTKEYLGLSDVTIGSVKAWNSGEPNGSQSTKRKFEELDDDIDHTPCLSPAKKVRTDAEARFFKRPPPLDTNLVGLAGRGFQSSNPSAGESSDMESVFEKEEVNLIPTGTPESYQNGSGPEIKIEEADENSPLTPTTKVEAFATCIEQDIATGSDKGSSLEADDSDLSDLPSDEELDDIHHLIIRRKKKSKGRTKRLAPPKPVVPEPEVKKVRYPSDYVNTPILLAEPFSTWTKCQTCANLFVQPNGYFHRRECPRCERHSMLYGYQWPKSEQIEDDEDRVLDHRTVHRFLSNPEEERLKKKIKSAEQKSQTPQLVE